MRQRDAGRACGTDGARTAATRWRSTKAEGKPSGNLTIANWALYIDKKTIPEFEQKTGIKVKYVEEINGYQEFFAKVRLQLARVTRVAVR